MNPNIIFIIGLISGAIITEIINIVFSPLKSWFNSSETKEYCSYDSYLTLQDRKEHKYLVRNDIMVTKQFGKTKNINCPYYKSKETEIKKFNGKKYLLCPFGETINQEMEDVKKCPFHK